MEPVRDGEVIPAEPTAATPELNDPLWRDVARDVASSQAERLPIVGTVLRVKEQRKLERRLRLIEATLQRLDVTVDEWDARLRDDEDLAELVGRAWDIVAEARSSEKVRILAAVVAAVSAGERLDVNVGQVLLGVVEQLEPLHFQTLVDVEIGAQQPPPMEDGGPAGIPGARRDVLEERAGIDPEVLGIVLADLEAKQLIANAYDDKWGGMEGKEAFVLTNLGDEVRKLMLEVGGTAQ